MNSIRTPRQGTTARSRRIAQAVDDRFWQQFRVSLKRLYTVEKLRALHNYHHFNIRHSYGKISEAAKLCIDINDCDICIRVDNYIKALCRGGQLKPGEG